MLIKEYKDSVQTQNRILVELTKLIKSLPDNPRIRRLSHNCFKISSKDLGNNWSVAHHDFRQQYDAIAEQLLKCDNVLIGLQKIIDSKKVICSHGSSGTLNLHKDVVEHLFMLYLEISNGS